MRLLTGLLCATCLMAQAAGTDVYLFKRSAEQLQLHAKVSDRDGYDNQPGFTSDSSAVLFSSDRAGGQTDLFRYDIASGEVTNLTQTPEQNEYSPQAHGSERFRYVLQEGAPYQNLWHQGYGEQSPQRLLTSYIPTAYYAVNDSGVLFWGRYTYSLFFEPAGVDVGPARGESLFVIGNAGRSLHPIPGSQTFSFVHKQSNWGNVIKAFDPADRSIVPIARLPGSNEDYCWTPEGAIWLFDGAKLLSLQPGDDAGWQHQQTLDAKGFVNGGRCAVSRDGHWLAVVNTFE